MHADSPIKNINEFIAYAKANPGLKYAAAGQYSQQHMATEAFAKCKGLKFTHVPTKGGSASINMFLGKHIDFLAGSGSHIPYVKSGRFRMILNYNYDPITLARDSQFPDVPIPQDLGCEGAHFEPFMYYMMVVGPKGIPDTISKMLIEAFKKASEGPDFQNLLTRLNYDYDFKDKTVLDKFIPESDEWHRKYFSKIGFKNQ